MILKLLAIQLIDDITPKCNNRLIFPNTTESYPIQVDSYLSTRTTLLLLKYNKYPFEKLNILDS